MAETQRPPETAATSHPERPAKVALYAGIVVERDAVSWSLLHKWEALAHLIALGAPLEVTVFAQAIDRIQPGFVLVPTVAELLGRDEFWDADVHVFEEGMYYELFDAVFLVPPDRPIMAIEHNSTPAELIDVPDARLAVERSHAQRHNLTMARHVACVSELNVEMARSVGVSEERISVLHLPPAVTPPAPPTPLSEHSGPVRLLYLGRFVRAKGITDMIELVTRLGAREDGRFEVTLAGDPRFSDPAQMAMMERLASSAPGLVHLALAPDDATLAQLFDQCDVLVIPSLHEGYCVPVIEAYGFGRFVIAYDAGNLPTILGGLGLLVPTGDLDHLEAAVLQVATALEEARRSQPLVLPTTSGELAEEAWAAAVAAHLVEYSAVTFERRFLVLLEDLLEASPGGLPPALHGAVTVRLEQLAQVEGGG